MSGVTSAGKLTAGMNAPGNYQIVMRGVRGGGERGRDGSLLSVANWRGNIEAVQAPIRFKRAPRKRAKVAEMGKHWAE